MVLMVCIHNRHVNVTSSASEAEQVLRRVTSEDKSPSDTS